MTLLQEVFKKIGCVQVLVFGLVFFCAGISASSFSFGKTKFALPTLHKKGKKNVPVQKEVEVQASVHQDQNLGVSKPTIIFTLKNDLGRKVFVVPFAYVKRFLTDTWHWENLSTCELEHGESAVVNVGAFDSAGDAETVFGALRLCSSLEEAQSATYELTDDYQRVDVGMFSDLHNKTVVLHTSKYGVGGERISYEVSPSQWKEVLRPLDFAVKNTHSEPVSVAAFFYGKEQDCDTLWAWRFTKSPVYRLNPGESTVIKVDVIKDPYDWKNIKGFLGVFNQNEELKAQNSTFELLVPSEKIALGPLSKLAGSQIALTSRLYGADTVFDFSTTIPTQSVKPAVGTTMAAT